MAINDLLAKMAEGLGLKETETVSLNRKVKEMQARIKDSEDQLDKIKDEISDVEGQIRAKKREYEESKSPAKKEIFKRELMTLLEKYKRIQQKSNQIDARIKNDQTIKDKLEQLIISQTKVAQVEETEELTAELDAEFHELRAEDAAIKKLNNLEYDRQTSEVSDDDLLEILAQFDAPQKKDKEDEPQQKSKADEAFEKQLAEFE